MVDAALETPLAAAGARRRSGFRKAMRRKSPFAFLMALPFFFLGGFLFISPPFYSTHPATLNKSMGRLVGVGTFLFLFKRETFWRVVQQSCFSPSTAVIFKALIGFIV